MNSESFDLVYPKVREDISFTRQVLRGEETFIAKDPVRRKFMQFDAFGRRICELCDGKRSIEEIRRLLSRDFTQYEIGLEYVREYVEHLQELKLILRDRFEYNVLVMERERRDRDRRNTLLHMRFPAFNPDASLEWLLQRVRWLFTRPFVALYLVLVIASYVILLAHIPEVFDGLVNFYAFKGWSVGAIFLLYVTIIAIIVFHEYGHGLSCKYFGGEVPQMGVLIIYLINPALYCNVSDSYRFPKKSSRLWVVAAGAVVELFIGAIAVFVWWLTDPTLIIHDFAFKIVIFCSITSILFNMNPLLKYDGYYALAEWLEIPNLRKRSFEHVGYLFRAKLFGLPAEPPAGGPRERRIFLIYGAAAVGYSLMIFSLIFALLKKWLVGSMEGLGWILLFAIMYLLLRKVLGKGAGALKLAVMDRSGAIRRHLPIVVTVLLLLILIPAVVKLPTVVQGSGILEPYSWQEMEAVAPGFVTELTVSTGARVRAGQLLAVIRSDSLAIALAGVKRREQRSRAAAGQAFAGGDASDAGGYLEEVMRLEMEKRDLAGLARGLTVTAPFDGIVLSPRVADLRYSFVLRGDALMRIGIVDSLRVRIEVHERELADLKIGTPVKFKSAADDWTVTRGRVVAIDIVGEMESVEEAETLRPGARYRVEMVLQNNDPRLLPGQSGRVRLYGKRRSLWALLFRSTLQTLRLDFFI